MGEAKLFCPVQLWLLLTLMKGIDIPTFLICTFAHIRKKMFILCVIHLNGQVILLIFSICHLFSQ